MIDYVPMNILSTISLGYQQWLVPYKVVPQFDS